MYKLLAAANLPVPEHTVFTIADMKPAVALLEKAPRRCVVKPACDSGGGVGVTTGVRTRWQLARAAWLATAAYGNYPLIEEQCEGQNYRLLYLDGELLDVVKREPPKVVADGRSAVRTLVDRVNQERLNRQGDLSHTVLTIDLDMKNTLREQGLSFRSVPAAGQVVRLKTAINENSAQDNFSTRSELCDEIVEECTRAAAISGLRLAGVDIITARPQQSLRDGKGVILEVNSPPGYYWHYHKRDGVCPVALHVLKALFFGHADRRGAAHPLASHTPARDHSYGSNVHV
jgi:D-alanine-D-alanine ligase-like ATP-grasp enzyme